MLVLTAVLMTHASWGEVNNAEPFIVMPALQGPSDTCLCPSSPSPAGEARNPSLMRRGRRLLLSSGLVDQEGVTLAVRTG